MPRRCPAPSSFAALALAAAPRNSTAATGRNVRYEPFAGNAAAARVRGDDLSDPAAYPPREVLERRGIPGHKGEEVEPMDADAPPRVLAA